MTTVLKIGGSVLTHKGERESIDEESLGRVAEEIGRVPDELVVVHGGGSFGHPLADAYGLSPTEGTHDAAAALDVHDAMGLLSDAVVSRFQDHGAAALPVHPLSAGYRDASDELAVTVAPIESMLAEGFVPVLHGDVVVHEGEGVTVVSGDELVTTIADDLDADRLGLCSSVPGVLDADGAVVGRVESFDAVSHLLGDAGTTDVTGGMAGKVRTLLELGLPASVFGLDDLAAFLDGGSPGTLVRGT